MPEGDTISRLAARIRNTHRNRRVASSIFRHPRLATVDLAGRTLTDATSHGKHLFIHWDDGWALHIHLLMQGVVRFGPTVPPVEEWKRRVEIRFEGGGVLTGVDIPILHRIRTSSIDRVVGHLGPDLCGRFDPTDIEVVTGRLETDGVQPLAGALLDQRNVAGFGNIYAVEVPFICGVAPGHPVGDVIGLDHLIAIGAALIRTNAHLGPQNTTGRRLSRDEHWVLDDRTTGCPLCGTRLERRTGGQTAWGRRTAWCPDCQRPGSGQVDVTRASKLMALHPARRLLDFDPGEGPPDGETARVRFTGPPGPIEPKRWRGRRQRP